MAIANPPAPVDQKGLMIADPAADMASKLERVLITGDLATLTPEQRVFYYREVCASVGLNPLTKPFDYLSLNGKLVLYANKSCTDQLRGARRIEVTKLERDRADDLAIVVAYVRDHTGRQDSAMGAVSILGLKGEALANALMKAETKAKRRATLSISGLGLLDEIEVESTPGAWRQDVDMETGELLGQGTPTAATLDERLAAQAAAAEAVVNDAAGVSPAPAEEPAGDSASAVHAGVEGLSSAPAPAPAEPTLGSASSGEVEPAGADAAPSPDTVIEGKAEKVDGLTAGELREWLRNHLIGITEATKAVRAQHGDKATVDSITDAQRSDLRAYLEQHAGEKP